VRGLTLASLAWLAACASPRPAGERAPQSRSMALAGPRCSGERCTCRALDDPQPEIDIAAGRKRFELRASQPRDAIEVAIEGRGSWTALPQEGASCAYVDLEPGRHRLRLQVRAAQPGGGIFPALDISEYGERNLDWYQSFRFRCGQPDPCDRDQMRQVLERAHATPRGIFDLCGSVRIENLAWRAARSPEAVLDDLEVELVLHVYGFAPRFRHGASSCKGWGDVAD
jgi:hypothetical protein